jgi:hypothetical protein
MTDKEFVLIDMMVDGCPIEEFQQLWESKEKLDWGELLHMCYCEESYESVSGDEGYLENPPINHERLAYLEQLIAFLEDKGIEERK